LTTSAIIKPGLNATLICNNINSIVIEFRVTSLSFF